MQIDTVLPQRFWDKVVPEPNTGCWLWVGATFNKYGYGAYQVASRVTRGAHRVAYEALVGPILEESLDHRCRVPACVNPAHLDPCSRSENSRRKSKYKTHCIRGHELSGDNLRIRPDKNFGRECWACHELTKEER